MPVSGSISTIPAPTSGGIPDSSGTPSPVSEADIWRDTSQSPARLMTLKGGVAVAIDTEETLTTDAFGSVINID